MFPRITRCLYCVQWNARNAFQKRTHNATLSVGGSSQWCAFNNAALCKRTASCICPRSLNAACFSGPLNSNSELLQVVNMVIALFVTHWILNEDLDKTLCLKICKVLGRWVSIPKKGKLFTLPLLICFSSHCQNVSLNLYWSQIVWHA